MPEFDSTIEYRSLLEYDGYSFGSDGSVWSSWERTYSKGREGSRCRKGSGWRSLKLMLNYKGYLFVNLRMSTGRVGRNIPVHHLILKAFVGERATAKHVCRHYDRDPSNNVVTNLRWGTSQENADDRVRHGTVLRGENHPRAKLTGYQVEEIRKLLADGVGCTAIARRYAVSKSSVKRIRSGQTWGVCENT